MAKTFIVAELSANHGGDLNIAKKTILSAFEAGADAIKLQTYTPDTMTLNSDKSYFKIKQDTIWDGQTLYDLYQKAYMPWEWQKKLKNYADEIGIILFSSPFDLTAVDFLEDLNIAIYKIASFEINDIPLIKYTASKQKPIIISTGIATYNDIKLAVQTCRDAGNNDITLLKCTSAYPAPIEEANLLSIPDLAKEFNVKVGFSDHTLGITASIVAVSLGAKIIEKHFILNKNISSPDNSFSLDPSEFRAMVLGIRDVEKLLGKISYELTQKTEKTKYFSRSLFSTKTIKKGEIFSKENIKSVRPNIGLHTKHYEIILGKKASKDIDFAEPLNWNDVE
jgi:pseudaminic acid synthase